MWKAYRYHWSYEHWEKKFMWNKFSRNKGYIITFYHLHLRNRLLDQGYKKICLIRSLKKFIFRYQDLVEIYSASAEEIIKMDFQIVKMYKDKV
jgi:hypothetical protein